MDMRRDKLVVNALGLHELLESRWAFVVKFLEKRAEAAGGKLGVKFCVGPNNFVLVAGFEWLS